MAVQLPKARPKHHQLPHLLHAWGKHPRLSQELNQPPHLICLSRAPTRAAGRLLKPQTQQWRQWQRTARPADRTDPWHSGSSPATRAHPQARTGQDQGRCAGTSQLLPYPTPEEPG